MLIFLKSIFIEFHIHIIFQSCTKISDRIIFLSWCSFSIFINDSKSVPYSFGFILLLRGYILELSKNSPISGVAILKKNSSINLLGCKSKSWSYLIISKLSSIISSLSSSTLIDLSSLTFLIMKSISLGNRDEVIPKKQSLWCNSFSYNLAGSSKSIHSSSNLRYKNLTVNSL